MAGLQAAFRVLFWPLFSVMANLEHKWLVQEYQKWNDLRGCSLEGEKWTIEPQPVTS